MLQKDRILLEHIITEKATEATSHANQYSLKVGKFVNQIAIKQAVEEQYDVKVKSVQIINVKPKFKSDRMRRGTVTKRQGYKKAIVRLVDGNTIELA